jgi:hypothetical protein
VIPGSHVFETSPTPSPRRNTASTRSTSHTPSEFGRELGSVTFCIRIRSVTATSARQAADRMTDFLVIAQACYSRKSACEAPASECQPARAQRARPLFLRFYA